QVADLTVKRLQQAEVARQAEIRVVAPQHLAEPGVLVRDRRVTTLPGRQPQFLKLSGQPSALRLSLHHEATIPRSAAVGGERKEGERRTTPLPAALSGQAGKPAEFDQTGLFFVEREGKLAHASTKGLRHRTSIAGILKAHHEIVGVAHDDYSTASVPTPPL